MSRPRSKIYAVLKGPDDWQRIHDSTLWSYDQNGLLRVEPEVFTTRAAPNVWTEAGWDKPPRTYPAVAGRILEPPPEPEPELIDEPLPHTTKEKVRRRSRETVQRTYSVPPETVEQVDLLCEAYNLSPSQVIATLVREAYRRDVVESGLIALFADDAVTGIIAPS